MEARYFSREYPESQNDADFCFPKGESYKQFYKRIVDFIKRLEKKHNRKTVLIVAHEGVIRAIEYYFGCFGFHDHHKRKISHKYIGRFVIDGGRPAKQPPEFL